MGAGPAAATGAELAAPAADSSIHTPTTNSFGALCTFMCRARLVAAGTGTNACSLLLSALLLCCRRVH